jgi:glycosyltransferase involved in cell wall biosynthesis
VKFQKKTQQALYRKALSALSGESDLPNTSTLEFLREDGLSWFTPPIRDSSGAVWQSGGFSDAALGLIKALNGLEIPVLYNNETPKYHVNFCPPEYFQYRNKCNIGYAPWEFTKLPERKVDNLNRCDYVWATSDFVKDVYIKNGVLRDIEVLPHGLSRDLDLISREVNGNFTFLLDNGGDLFLETVYKTVEAFLSSGFDKNVKLVVKTTRPLDVEVNSDQVLYVSNFLPEHTYRELFYKSHVLIYPSNGEGFGLIPFQALSTGMPSIATHLTGCSQYKEHTIEWPHLWEPAAPVLPDGSLLYDENLGDWIVPDYESLPEILRDVYENYHEHKVRAFKSAKILRASEDWGNIADRLVVLIDSIEKS